MLHIEAIVKREGGGGHAEINEGTYTCVPPFYIAY
jgi:hypothetical protein